jgi:pyruvyltransferase
MTTANPVVTYWNPKRRMFRSGILSRLPIYRRVNNFGDIVGPVIVERLFALRGLVPPAFVPFDDLAAQRQVLTVGSVLNHARDNDIVWGSGRNGKIADEKHRFKALDVRMTRGPKTRAFLESRGIPCPEIYGDPALLFPTIWKDRIATWRPKTRGLTIIPNLNDPKPKSAEGTVLNPQADLWTVIRTIYESEAVVSSSLHGFVFAEVFGVSARLLASRAEPAFKYEDYMLGTGRGDVRIYDSVAEALSAPGQEPPRFDADRMIEAFPFDAFSA